MADFVEPQRVSTFAAYPGGHPIPVVAGTGVRVTATAEAGSTAAAPIPTGGNILLIRATGPVWIRFGAAAVGAAAADNSSILFVTGEAPYILKAGETHFRVLRAGLLDSSVQLESVGTL